MRRVWTSVLLLVTVGVLTATVYVVAHKDPVPHAGQTPGYVPPSPSTVAATASHSPSAPRSATGSPKPTTHIHTLFLGDDYTLGDGASSGATPWTTTVSKALGLDPTVVGAEGAGYAKTSSDGKTYLSLLDGLHSKPDLIVVSGGRNDVVDDPGTLRSHAKQFFDKLHSRFPTAHIVAIAPFWGDSAHPAKLAPVNAAVKDGVRAAKGTYLNMNDPLTGHSDFMANDADPNDKGYAAIAAAVIDELRHQLPR